MLETLVRLLDTTWLRIGNAAYAEANRSDGLSTLRNHHAGVRGDELQLSFVGKAGVRHIVRQNDRRAAQVVCRKAYLHLQGAVLVEGVADAAAGGQQR